MSFAEKLVIQKNDRSVWIFSGVIGLVLALVTLIFLVGEGQYIFAFDTPDAWINVIWAVLVLATLVGGLGAGVLALMRRPVLVPGLLIIAIGARFLLTVFFFLVYAANDFLEGFNFFTWFVPLASTPDAFGAGILPGIRSLLGGIAFYAAIVVIILGFRALRTPTPDVAAGDRKARNASASAGS